MTSSAHIIQQSRGTGSEGDYLDRIELTAPHTQRFEHRFFQGQCGNPQNKYLKIKFILTKHSVFSTSSGIVATGKTNTNGLPDTEFGEQRINKISKLARHLRYGLKIVNGISVNLQFGKTTPLCLSISGNND